MFHAKTKIRRYNILYDCLYKRQIYQRQRRKDFDDPGFLYGDGIFETLRTYNGENSGKWKNIWSGFWRESAKMERVEVYVASLSESRHGF